jgi:hypothetical protein
VNAVIVFSSPINSVNSTICTRVQNIIFIFIDLNIQFSRNLCKDDGDIVLFSTEKQNELKSGLFQNSHGRSSKRYVSIVY